MRFCISLLLFFLSQSFFRFSNSSFLSINFNSKQHLIEIQKLYQLDSFLDTILPSTHRIKIIRELLKLCNLEIGLIVNITSTNSPLYLSFQTYTNQNLQEVLTTLGFKLSNRTSDNIEIIKTRSSFRTPALRLLESELTANNNNNIRQLSTSDTIIQNKIMNKFLGAKHTATPKDNTAHKVTPIITTTSTTDDDIETTMLLLKDYQQRTATTTNTYNTHTHSNLGTFRSIDKQIYDTYKQYYQKHKLIKCKIIHKITRIQICYDIFDISILNNSIHLQDKMISSLVDNYKDKRIKAIFYRNNSGKLVDIYNSIDSLIMYNMIGPTTFYIEFDE